MNTYSTKAIESAIARSKFTEEQIKGILKARGYKGELLKTKTRELSQTTQTNLLAAQKTGTDSASGFAFQGLADKLNANPKFLGGLTAATAAAGVVYALWKNYKQQMAEAVQASAEAGTAFRESAEGMDAQIAAVQQLRAKLADSSTSEEEAISIKKQLLDIQDSLCSKYGESAKNISLVNGNLETQLGLMRGLTKEDAETYLNDAENRKGFKEAKKQMTEKKPYLAGRVAYRDTEAGQIIEKTVQEFESKGLKAENTGTGFIVKLKENAENAEEILGGLQRRLKEIQKDPKTSPETSRAIDSFLDQTAEAYTRAKDTIKTNKQPMLDGLHAEMTSEGTGAGSSLDIYENYADAVGQYNEALRSGENIAAAKKQYEAAKKSAEKVKKNHQEYAPLFDELDGGLDTRSAGLYRFTEDLSKDRKLSQYANDLKKLGLDEADVRDFDPEDKKTEDGEKAFEKLNERADKYKLEFDDLIQKLTELGIIQGELGTDTEASAPLSSTDILGNVQSLSEGFGQLQRIYAGISDGDSFDWFSILNNEGFRTAFEDCDRAYEDFRETISGSPDDIDACQSAFDDLAATYLNESDVLCEVTDTTKDSATAMLEQMGIANATEVVEAKLAETKAKLAAEEQYLAETGKDLADATYEDIAALNLEGIEAEATRQYLANLALSKIDITNNPIDSKEDIDNIIAIAKAAGTSAEYVDALKAALINLQNAQSKRTEAINKTISGSNPIGQLLGKTVQIGAANLEVALAQQEVQNVLDSIQKVNLDASDFYATPHFTGGPTISTPGNNASAASASPSASSSAPAVQAETFDFIDTLITRLEKKLDRYNSIAEDTARSFSGRIRNYRKEIRETSNTIDILNQSYNAYMSRADGAGLEAEWAAQVRDGNVNIADITDEGLKKRISEYQKWYDKAQSVKDKIDELKEKQKELNRSKFELQINKYEKETEQFESKNERIENKISLKESWGNSADASDYKNMNRTIRKQISNTAKSNTELRRLQKTVAKSSEQWLEYQKRIDSNNSSLQKLRQSIVDNAKAMAALSRAGADKNIEHIDAKDELYEAKKDSASSDSSKNKLADRQITNVRKRQKENQKAYNDSSRSLKSARRAISRSKKKKTNTKNKSTNKQNKEYNSVLAKIKSAVKSGKRISDSLLEQAGKLKDQKLYEKCVQYNAYYDETQSNKEILDIFKETAKQKKRDLAIEQVQNVADSYDAKLAGMDTVRSRREASIAKMEEAGVSPSKQQYKSQIKDSQSRQSQLRAKRNSMQKKLDEMVKKGHLKKTDAQYKEMQNTISSLNVEIAECITEQIAWNKALDQMDLTNLKALGNVIDSLKSKMAGLASLTESHKHAVSDMLLTDQIQAEQQSISNANEQISKYAANLKKYATASVGQGGWGLELKSAQADMLVHLAKAQDIDGIKAFCKLLGIEYDRYAELQELIQNMAEEQNNILSSKISQEEFYDALLQKRIDSLNNIISAMDEMNEKKDRALALEKAMLNLEKAKNNLTMKVWNGTEWIYDADRSAVKEAQEAFDNAEFEELKNVIQDAVDAIEELIKSNNLYNDNGSVSQEFDQILKTVQTLDQDLSEGLVKTLKEKYPEFEWAQLLEGTGINSSNTFRPSLIPAESFLTDWLNAQRSPLNDNLSMFRRDIFPTDRKTVFDNILNNQQQNIRQEFHVSIPNISDSRQAIELVQEFERLSASRIQYFNQKK